MVETSGERGAACDPKPTSSTAVKLVLLRRLIPSCSWSAGSNAVTCCKHASTAPHDGLDSSD